MAVLELTRGKQYRPQSRDKAFSFRLVVCISICIVLLHALQIETLDFTYGRMSLNTMEGSTKISYNL